jgi:hypothetical protein
MGPDLKLPPHPDMKDSSTDVATVAWAPTLQELAETY